MVGEPQLYKVTIERADEQQQRRGILGYGCPACHRRVKVDEPGDYACSNCGSDMQRI